MQGQDVTTVVSSFSNAGALLGDLLQHDGAMRSRRHRSEQMAQFCPPAGALLTRDDDGGVVASEPGRVDKDRRADRQRTGCLADHVQVDGGVQVV